MRLSSHVILFITLMLLCGCALGCKSGPSKEFSARDMQRIVEVACKPAEGLLCMSPFELQIVYRLAGLMHIEHYRYNASHAPAWQNLMRDEQASIYGRMCAAYFLLDSDKEARDFITAQINSPNVRHRYNAAKVLEMYTDSTDKTWAIDLLIAKLDDGSLARNGVNNSSGIDRKDFPEGDGWDIVSTPIEAVCGRLSSLGIIVYVPMRYFR